MTLTSLQVTQFRKKVYDYFDAYGRDLPWRDNPTPYQVLVSEVMLQQTQVDRVLPKYIHFITTFPDFNALATATTQDVLLAWSGLGYNSRGVRLLKTAHIVLEKHEGQLPQDHESLDDLPGIGSATASSIQAFAFNIPSVFIETNIRSVLIHEFFPNELKVDDDRLLPLVRQTLDADNPRRWYNALMDYGTYLKAIAPNPSQKSAHYTKQSRFIGSDRQIRGQILKELLKENSWEMHKLTEHLHIPFKRLETILAKMVKEELVAIQNNVVTIL